MVPHTSHLCDLIPAWMRRCLFRSLFRKNDLQQTSHLWSFIPVWMSRWLFRSLFRKNDLPQISHLCGFISVWIWRWPFRYCLCLHDLPQTSHLVMIFFLYGSPDVLSAHLRAKTIHHKPHTCVTLLLCVGLKMAIQMVFLFKGSTTDVTLVWCYF